MKPRKKSRGPTKNLKLHLKDKNEKWFVDFCQEGKPIGKYTRVFVNHIGKIVRTAENAPLNVKEFLELDQKYRDKISDNIVEHFGFKDDKLTTQRVWQTVNKICKNFRSKLHKEYLKFESDEERLANRPPNVLPNDWIWLVNYFGTDAYKKLSERNKRSRSQQKSLHTSGPKSIVEIEDDEITRNGSCSQLKLCQLTHTRKDGTYVDQASQEAMSKAKETVKANKNSSNPMTEDDIYVACVTPKEKHGRVLGKGSFVSPTQVYGSSSTQKMILKENAELKEELKEVKEQLRMRDAKVDQIESKLEMILNKVNGSTSQGAVNDKDVNSTSIIRKENDENNNDDEQDHDDKDSWEDESSNEDI